MFGLIYVFEKSFQANSLLVIAARVLRQNVRVDLIPFLNLPSSLIDFVLDQRYI